jgi:NADPH:quinone reductase-like Zn-dependent oxidoreductase
MTGEPLLSRIAGYGVRRPKRPVLGGDLAGRVEAVGRGVARFAIGDEVFGTGSGTFAELAAAGEDRLAPLPAGLTFEQAAAVPTSGATALQAGPRPRAGAGRPALTRLEADAERP